MEEFVKNIRNLPILENVTIIELDATKMTGSYVDSLFAENNLDFLSKQKKLVLVRNFEDHIARISKTNLRSGYAHDWSQGLETYLHNLDSSDRQKPWKYFCNLPF